MSSLKQSVLLSKDLHGDMELLPSKQAPIPIKKRGAKQKERDKKKLQKLLDKKSKQDKMRNILTSLEAHKSDIKVEDFAKFKSAKLMGMKQNEPKMLGDKKEMPSVAPDLSSSESEDERLEVEGVSG